jgi:hypothetical protein
MLLVTQYSVPHKYTSNNTVKSEPLTYHKAIQKDYSESNLPLWDVKFLQWWMQITIF